MHILWCCDDVGKRTAKHGSGSYAYTEEDRRWPPFCPRSPSAKRVRAAISGLLYHARVGTAAVCGSALRNRGLRARSYAQSYIAFLHSPLTEQVPPTRLSTFFQQRRAACQSQVPGTGWASGPTPPRRSPWTTAEVPSNFQLTDDCAGFQTMLNRESCRCSIWEQHVWRWDCVERRSRIHNSASQERAVRTFGRQSLGESLPTLSGAARGDAN